jgi:hypothetical protein
MSTNFQTKNIHEFQNLILSSEKHMTNSVLKNILI